MMRGLQVKYILLRPRLSASCSSLSNPLRISDLAGQPIVRHLRDPPSLVLLNLITLRSGTQVTVLYDKPDEYNHLDPEPSSKICLCTSSLVYSQPCDTAGHSVRINTL